MKKTAKSLIFFVSVNLYITMNYKNVKIVCPKKSKNVHYVYRKSAIFEKVLEKLQMYD